MRRSLSIVVLLLVVTAGASSAFAGGPALVGDMAAHKIVLNDEKGEVAVPAEQVYPEDVVEYTLRYRNSGDAPAAGVALVGPVPQGTDYLDRTATDVDGLRPIFSIDDGKTYSEAPVTYVVLTKDGGEERREATPDMYTHVKWVMGNALDVGGEVTVTYRVRVK
ncbi:MAG: DUF11 domain-containing protein [Candidatus Krumholzibacteriota bacterium]|nr:DUF11 domain-containing protein [Candidatus Krumholzibacteriota bacterium]